MFIIWLIIVSNPECIWYILICFISSFLAWMIILSLFTILRCNFGKLIIIWSTTFLWSYIYVSSLVKNLALFRAWFSIFFLNFIINIFSHHLWILYTVILLDFISRLWLILIYILLFLGFFGNHVFFRRYNVLYLSQLFLKIWKSHILNKALSHFFYVAQNHIQIFLFIILHKVVLRKSVKDHFFINLHLASIIIFLLFLIIMRLLFF